MESRMNGAFIKGEKKLELTEYVKKHPEYQLLVTTLQEVSPFDSNNVEIKLAYQFDQFVEEDKVVTAEFIIFSYNNGKATIRYDAATSNKADHSFSFLGKVSYVGDDSSNMIKIFTIKNGKVEQIHDKLNEGELSDHDISSLVDDPDYIPGELINHVFAEDFPFSVCMIDGLRFYRHCGPGCGDGLTFGGGEPINSLDYCCRAHDRCYTAFGYGACNCDNALLNCASLYENLYPASVAIINLAFNYC
ncbi:hypothetical protein [Paenibacillus piscarius]|uniref:hypothetical protein n=1 Tax=Paenibacillus piscarius TaxID=1089681 RepID=UPI001EE7A229|nr:hypothetical protein [Paenibacillus piscarius]